MPEKKYSINVALKAETDLKPYQATEGAIKKVDEAAQKMGREVSKSGTDIEKAFAEAKAASEKLKQSLQEGGKESGEALSDGVEEGLKAGPLGDLGTHLMGYLNPATVAAAGAVIGKLLGDEIGKAMTQVGLGGTWTEYFEDLKSRIGELTGITSLSWDKDLREANEAVQISLSNSRREWQDFKTDFAKAPPDDAIAWLDEMERRLGLLKSGLDAISEQAKLQRKANIDRITEDEKDALQALAQDPTKTQSDRLNLTNQIQNDAEKRRLQERQQGRAEQRALAWAKVAAAEQAAAQKRALEEAAVPRAQAFNQARSVANANSQGAEGDAKDNLFNLHFQTTAKDLGYTDLSTKRDEQEALLKVKEERIAAEKEIAKVRDEAWRETKRLEIEGNTDAEITNRRLDRERLKAASEAEAAADKEAQAAEVPMPDDSVVTRDMSGEAQARDVLGRLSKGTGNAQAKASYEGLSGSLYDQQTTDGEKAKLAQLAKNLADSGSQQGTELAAKINEALAKINASQAAFKAQMAEMDARINALDSKSSNP